MRVKLWCRWRCREAQPSSLLSSELSSAHIAKRRHPRFLRVAATALGVALGEIRLVAAHGWDIAGALAVGCHASFVRRPGMAVIPFADQPDVIGEDLVEVAEEITESAGR